MLSCIHFALWWQGRANQRTSLFMEEWYRLCFGLRECGLDNKGISLRSHNVGHSEDVHFSYLNLLNFIRNNEIESPLLAKIQRLLLKMDGNSVRTAKNFLIDTQVAASGSVHAFESNRNWVILE